MRADLRRHGAFGRSKPACAITRLDAFGIDWRIAAGRTLAVHQGTRAAVAVAGQVDDFLPQFGEQRLIIVGRAMGVTVPPVVTSSEQVTHMRVRQPQRPVSGSIARRPRESVVARIGTVALCKLLRHLPEVYGMMTALRRQRHGRAMPTPGRLPKEPPSGFSCYEVDRLVCRALLFLLLAPMHFWPVRLAVVGQGVPQEPELLL